MPQPVELKLTQAEVEELRHHLLNALTPVSLCACLMQRCPDGPNRPECGERLKHIESGVGRVVQYLDHLTEISRT